MKTQRKHKLSTLSRKKQRQRGARSERNGRQGVKFAVTCTKHGVKSKGESVSWLIVSPPRGKKQGQSGCPYCLKLQQKSLLQPARGL